VSLRELQSAGRRLARPKRPLWAHRRSRGFESHHLHQGLSAKSQLRAGFASPASVLPYRPVTIISPRTGTVRARIGHGRPFTGRLTGRASVPEALLQAIETQLRRPDAFVEDRSGGASRAGPIGSGRPGSGRMRSGCRWGCVSPASRWSRSPVARADAVFGVRLIMSASWSAGLSVPVGSGIQVRLTCRPRVSAT